jgi:hypothetical protein
MSSLPSKKLEYIDLSKYYGKVQKRNTEGENITCTTPIFRLNLNTLLYEELISIEQNGKTVKTVWQVYDENHNKLDSTTEENFELNTLYDLDQLFGGA